MDIQKLFANADARIETPLDLTEFHERFVNADGSPQIVQVWLNPPRPKMVEINNIEDREERGAQRIGFQIGLDPDETRTLFAKDALFCAWLVTRVLELTAQYAEGRRKKSETD